MKAMFFSLVLLFAVSCASQKAEMTLGSDYLSVQDQPVTLYDLKKNTAQPYEALWQVIDSKDSIEKVQIQHTMSRKKALEIFRDRALEKGAQQFVVIDRVPASQNGLEGLIVLPQEKVR